MPSKQKLWEALEELLSYVGDGESLMRDELVKFRNGRVDADASSANAEHNEQIRRVVAQAREALRPDEEEETPAVNEGRGAYIDRKPKSANPYPFLSPEHDQWAHGYTLQSIESFQTP